jgi:hypothetical protein
VETRQNDEDNLLPGEVSRFDLPELVGKLGQRGGNGEDLQREKDGHRDESDLGGAADFETGLHRAKHPSTEEGGTKEAAFTDSDPGGQKEEADGVDVGDFAFGDGSPVGLVEMHVVKSAGGIGPVEFRTGEEVVVLDGHLDAVGVDGAALLPGGGEKRVGQLADSFVADLLAHAMTDEDRNGRWTFMSRRGDLRRNGGSWMAGLG